MTSNAPSNARAMHACKARTDGRTDGPTDVVLTLRDDIALGDAREGEKP